MPTTDAKIMVYGGILHDIGKTKINPELLKKKEHFSKEEMEEMRKHPVEGYNLLKETNYFSALIALYHHHFSKDSYPKIIPKSKIAVSKNTLKRAMHYARIIGVVDSYDAISTRKNDKYNLEKKILSAKERKIKLLDDHPKDVPLINRLYYKEIFR